LLHVFVEYHCVRKFSTAEKQEGNAWTAFCQSADMTPCNICVKASDVKLWSSGM